MLGFLGRRIVSGVVLVFAITTLAFLLLYLGSGDIARRILGQTATQEQVTAKAHELGLDRPIWEQYTGWLGNALSGNLGRSWFSGQLVIDGVTNRLTVTLSLVIGATIITALIAVVLGVWAALAGGWVDRTIQFLTVLGMAVPGFLIAVALVVVFAINLGWFNATGYTSIADDAFAWARSVTLPIVALSIGGASAVTQQIRGSVVDALQRDYVRTLRSRGLSTRSVVFKHVLRNAVGPALAVLNVQFVGMLGGAVIVEQVFQMPGLGQLAVGATTQGDVPIVMGLVVTTAIIVIVVNLVIDIAQGLLNPKVRLA
ncbi:ABC transporter permease [Tessaracoccus aquimaris]|uniref:ABC transporter permease n=1 Tax=Tessaracoccus aquimaris TaxID=1332264 RepID=A0A1Q2CPH0_9ACTN|nr:ABC transporter permease [Tessaracoccus aquimaris]AQP48011.1 ABC transporter permease [Tessaracoccus aquimaris]